MSNSHKAPAEFTALLKKFNYSLPPELIAQAPASPRDSARLLIYQRYDKRIWFDRFLNLPKYLPKGAVLVFNDTKVIPARLTLQKPTGGLVRVLYLGHTAREVEVLADRFVTPLTPLTLRGGYEFLVTRKKDSHYFLKPSFPMSKLHQVLQRYGQTPIPPYIKYSPLSEKKLREQYQTIFARYRGSVAAPTASLHFTKRLIAKLKRAGQEIHFVTLHVNLGTFAPPTKDQLERGTLHREFFEITKKCAAALNYAKRAGRPIIAVGTTVARTLESAADAHGDLRHLSGTTDLFIQPGYCFKFVDGLVTNFHVPHSSLLMLVSALTGRATLLNLYQRAIQKRFKFFSFGDGMLIL